VFKVKGRVYGQATDGRTVLLFTPGAVITDDEARRVGLPDGVPAPEKPARGLTVLAGERESDEPEPAKSLQRMTLAELRAACEEEGIDPGDANLRAEFIEAIEAGRAASAED
jgi:hypothetical protein